MLSMKREVYEYGRASYQVASRPYTLRSFRSEL